MHCVNAASAHCLHRTTDVWESGHAAVFHQASQCHGNMTVTSLKQSCCYGSVDRDVFSKFPQNCFLLSNYKILQQFFINEESTGLFEFKKSLVGAMCSIETAPWDEICLDVTVVPNYCRRCIFSQAVSIPVLLSIDGTHSAHITPIAVRQWFGDVTTKSLVEPLLDICWYNFEWKMFWTCVMERFRVGRFIPPGGRNRIKPWFKPSRKK